jgi:outer membrane protein
MTRRAIAIVAVTVLLCQPVAAETLGEAIAMAYASNPQLAAAQAQQDALTEAPEQARAAGRPTIAAVAGAGYDELGFGRTASASVAVGLPIWTGGRVPSAVRAARGDVAAGAEDLRDMEAAILQSVVVAYGGLLYSQQAVEIARVGIERLDRQVAEARSRFDLGRATRTDVAQLEAQRASVVASLADAEGALATAAATYRAVVGRDANMLSAEVPPPLGLPATLAEARDQTAQNNPLILGQSYAVKAAAARVDQARSEGAPSLDATGAYGRGARLLGGDVHGFEPAASAGITIRLPLSNGGFVRSRVRQAEALLRAERFGADAAAREAIRATDSAWASLVAAQTRLRANVEGLAAADLALRGVRAEYGFALRSTIDILVAEQSFRAAQLAVAAARTDVLVAQATLLRATGRLGPRAYS